MQACKVTHEEEQVRKCQDLLNYGESEDPAKMTDSKNGTYRTRPKLSATKCKTTNLVSIHCCRDDKTVMIN